MHMLNEHEKTEIDKEIAKFPIKQSACLEALMIVQHGRGYVSDESLKAVAEYLEMSATELDSIATGTHFSVSDLIKLGDDRYRP